ncbi:hypothetical protein [Kitasatospora sp. NBC_00315]|uniref:hypothetical protein n=1 Tax=Kitasatospora sp. NBC_00315 TaxID=2975963 RepID=UPI00324ABB5A
MRTFVPAGAADAGAAADGPSPSWGIRGAVRLAFPHPAALAADPVHTGRLRRYLTDLLRPYGRELDPGALGPDAVHRGGQVYGEMAEALIRATVPAGESVDLLVLAYSVPDITPGRATTTYLSHVCPGTPMAFAVSDQGPASAFTALRLVDAYARSGGLRRALLLVVEQDSLPYDPGVPVNMPTGSRGVALLFGEPLPGERVARISRAATRTLPADCSTVSSADASIGSPAAALATELGRLGLLRDDPLGDDLLRDDPLRDDPATVTAILGATAAVGAAHRWPEGLRLADTGQPGTGVWWELAGELAEPPAGPHRLLLADYDAGARRLSLATVSLDDLHGLHGLDDLDDLDGDGGVPR